MAERTDISWVNRTWSPWIGCQKVGPACDGCYAEHLMDTRLGRVVWGPGEERKRTSPGYWKQLRKWEREAVAKGERDSVFPSLCDPWDNAVPLAWLRDYFDEIRATPHIDHLLLTKRPGNIVTRYFEAHLDLPDGGSGYPWPKNAWIGATVVTQQEADRDIPKLLAAKRELEVPVAFLSMEPLLEPVDLRALAARDNLTLDALTGFWTGSARFEGGFANYEAGLKALPRLPDMLPSLDWVITGGETDQGKHRARPSHPGWFRELRDQCAAAGVAYHHKQNGEWVAEDQAPENTEWDGERTLFHRFGDGEDVWKVGKKWSGRLLDGVQHDARPAVQP